jgi:PKD repeat protein
MKMKQKMYFVLISVILLSATALAVSAAGEPPVASFYKNTTNRFAPMTVAFTDTSTGSPTFWSWDFGDGGTSDKQNPTYTFLTAGSYTVTLTVSNEYGSSSFSDDNINVFIPLAASFSASPIKGDAPLTVTFIDNSRGASEWRWDFGDGTTSDQQNPVHVYIEPGKYDVTLTVGNIDIGGGDIFTMKKEIHVQKSKRK